MPFLTTSTSKKLNQLLAFLNSYQHEKMTLFHLFNFEPHDQTGHTHFWSCTPKNFWSAFNFCDHVSTCKTSVYLLHLLILQIQSILESHHQTGHTHFWPCSFLTMITHILREIVSARKKSGSSISSFLRYSQF